MSASHSEVTLGGKKPAYGGRRVNFYWFSDTFIIFSNEFSFDDIEQIVEERLNLFFHSVRMLYLRFMLSGFPLRGGIDYGEFFVDPDENIYLVDDLPEGSLDLEALLEPYYEAIFEEELNAWHRREEDWPQRRDDRPLSLRGA